MKFALFTAPITSHETKSFFASAKKLGHELDVIPIQSLFFELSTDGKIDIKVGSNVKKYLDQGKGEGVTFNPIRLGHDLSNYDAIITRGGLRTNEPQRAMLKILMYKYYSDLGIPVLNGESQLIKADNKLWQHFQFSRAGIPVVPTKFVSSEELLEEATKDMTYPLFVKEERGSHGAKTMVPQNVDELRTMYEQVERPAYMLVQKHLRTRSDLRVLIVGNKVLGGMKRTAAEGSHISNFSAGGSIEAAKLSAEEKNLALKAAKALKSDYGGADLMRDEDDNIYVLEFNRNASFKGFEQSTGIDVPKEVFDYLATRVK